MIDEQDFVSDDEIDQIYDESPQGQPVAMAPMTPGAAPMGNVGGMPVYPLALAQAPAVSSDNILTRKVGPLPIWGWALTAIGTGVGGYFWWQSTKKVSKNDGGEEGSERDLPELPESTSAGSWNPSRGRFAEQVGKYFARKGMSDKVKVYDDADEAKKKLKHVSPLINLKCDVTFKPDKDFERLCKREGLSPIVHDDGTVGLYPSQSGKRAAEWEKYIDLLREDGQTV